MKRMLSCILCALLMLNTLSGMAYANNADIYEPASGEPEVTVETSESAGTTTGEALEEETQLELPSGAEEPQETSAEGEETEEGPAEEGPAEEEEPDEFDIDAYGLNEYIAASESGLTVSGNILINDTVIIPKGMIFTFAGGKIIVNGGCLYIEGCLVITDGSVEVLAGASLTNEGLIFVSENGLLSVDLDAEFVAGEGSALVLDQSIEGAGASIVGIDSELITVCSSPEDVAQFIKSSESEEDEQVEFDIDAATLNESIATSGSELSVSGNILINDTVLIPEDMIFTVTGGTIVVDNGRFCVEGCLNLVGGSLEVKAGSAVVNNAFISVSNSGSISLDPEAEYESAEGSVLLLDRSPDVAEASIEGIAHSQIELCVFAADAETLMQYIYAGDYPVITVAISDMSLIYCIDGELPKGVNITFRQ